MSIPLSVGWWTDSVKDVKSFLAGTMGGVLGGRGGFGGGSSGGPSLSVSLLGSGCRFSSASTCPFSFSLSISLNRWPLPTSDPFPLRVRDQCAVTRTVSTIATVPIRFHVFQTPAERVRLRVPGIRGAQTVRATSLADIHNESLVASRWRTELPKPVGRSEQFHCFLVGLQGRRCVYDGIAEVAGVPVLVAGLVQT